MSWRGVKRMSSGSPPKSLFFAFGGVVKLFLALLAVVLQTVGRTFLLVELRDEQRAVTVRTFLCDDGVLFHFT